MKTSLDCIPCFFRQALEAARFATDDPSVHERVVRDVLAWSHDLDLNQSPPVVGQKIHRRLRELTGLADPYRAAKDRFDALARELLGGLEAKVQYAPDSLTMAVRLAIAGNVIDLGVDGGLSETEVRRAIDRVLSEPFVGEVDELRDEIGRAGRILYLADNAGEIVFDRLLLRRLPQGKVTVAVRGGPVLNDATLTDARQAGIDELAEVIDNGSDAPGTILEDCSASFRRRFDDADLILAKGQGNFETLSDSDANIFFLFKVKCPVIGAGAGHPTGTHVLARPRTARRSQPDALTRT